MEDVIVELEFTYIWSNMKFAAIIVNNIYMKIITM